MPEWLLVNENYKPKSDHDGFIDKSIKALLSLLARMRNQSKPTGRNHNVNAEIKVAFTFLLLLMIALSNNLYFIFIINVFMLISLSLENAEIIVRILKVGSIAAGFTFIMLLPSLISGNNLSWILIPAKVFPSVMAINLLAFSTPWHSITSALKIFLVPNIFILVLDITVKYIVHLGNFSLDMLNALKMRSIGRNTSKTSSMSGISATMFIKSKEMADDMYAAMQCRGWTGEYKIYRKFKFTSADFRYSATNAVIIIVFLLIGKL